MNEIKVIVNFKNRNISTIGVDLTSGDYNSTKMKFTFDRTDGRKVFEMKNPNGELAMVTEIQNNEVLLVGKADVTTKVGTVTYIKYINENDTVYWYDAESEKLYNSSFEEVQNVDIDELTKVTKDASLFTMAGKYIFEISLYDGDSKLTSASSYLKVKQENVVIGDEVVETYLPIFDELMNDIQTALIQTNNLDIDVSKEGTTSTVTITKKDGTSDAVQILDGAKGEDGEPGQDGRDGRDGRDGYVQYSAGDNITIENDTISASFNEKVTDVKVNGTSVVANKIANVSVPTKLSDLTNDSGFITTETDPTVPSHVKNITQQDITDWNNKSDFSGDYNDLSNKPSINNITLIGNKTSSDLGLQPSGDYALRSEIPDVSSFITKDVNDLTYYTKTSELAHVALSGQYGDLSGTPDLSGFATTTNLNNEITNRENADIGLQGQIDAITSSSDVRDIVGTYTELQNYDTSSLGNYDIIKVLQDSTHNDAMTYYRWVITGGTGSWQYVGQEGPYYTKSETNTLLNAKQNEITSSNKLLSDLVDDTNQTNQFVTATEKQTWNNKIDSSALTNYVKNTDYAGFGVAGVFKMAGNSGLSMYQGQLFTDKATDEQILNRSSQNRVITPYNLDYAVKVGVTSNTNTLSSAEQTSALSWINGENVSNKVTSISSSSTDTQYPTAKCVYDIVGDIESILTTLTTGTGV